MRLTAWRAWLVACVALAVGSDVAADAAPRRIVSLLPSLTETVCALGACERLVGTDRYSNWPASVNALPKLGGLDELQVERLVALKPDLVLMADSMRAGDRLRGLGLRVVTMEPRSLADTHRVFTQVATLLGQASAADALWQRTQARLQAAAAQVPAAWRGKRVYFEIASTPYAASESSFLGELLARLSLHNVVAGELGPFPQLSPEWVVKSSPQLLMGTAQAVREMPQRPGWVALPAVAQGRLCGFEPHVFDTLMRPGPRLPEAAEALLQCLRRLSPP